MNKRSTLKNNGNILEIGGVSAISLAKEFGTPLYVYDETYLEEMCEVFSQTLKSFYGKGMVSYASKAFCCKEIYRLISRFNLGADVVSLGELETALSVGFSAKNLIFHGNNKSFEELQRAIEEDIGFIVIDSNEEADLIEEICLSLNKCQNVLIRVNPGVEAHTHEFIQTARVDSKFGFSIENGDALNFIKKISQKKHLNLLGLHCHIGSQIFGSDSFLLAIEKMTDFYVKCKFENQINFSVLDLGGGFGIYYSDNDPKFNVSDYASIIKLICESLKNKCLKKKLELPFLILEPGRAIVGEAGVTLYSVGNTKEIKNVKNYVAVDGGIFENPRFALYQAKYSVECANKMLEQKNIVYSIAGKCCESGDLIAENVLLPELKKGDYLAVFSTGAYNYSMASNYNRNAIPAVVFVKNGNARVVVKRQSINDLLNCDL